MPTQAARRTDGRKSYTTKWAEQIASACAQRDEALALAEKLRDKCVKIGVERDRAMAVRDRAVESLAEEAQKSSAALADSMKLAKLTRQLAIIEHIVSGRQAEAISALLDPVGMVLNLCFQMTDEARVASRKEMMDGLKASLIESIGKIQA